MTHFPSQATFLAMAAQVPTDYFLTGLYFAMVATALLFVLIILAVLVRKILHSTDRVTRAEGLNLATMNEMGRKGLLNPDELRRVREAIVRQTISSMEEADESKAAPSVSPVKKSEAQFKPMAEGVAAIPAAPTQPPAEIHEERRSAAPEGEASGKNKPLDIEKLLQKGLISQTEYEQLRKTFGGS